MSHTKKRELLPDEGLLFLSRTFARHRRGHVSRTKQEEGAVLMSFAFLLMRSSPYYFSLPTHPSYDSIQQKN